MSKQEFHYIFLSDGYKLSADRSEDEAGGQHRAFSVQLNSETLIPETEFADLALALDLFTLGGAVYAVDWLSKGQKDVPRHLEISIPTFRPSHLRQYSTSMSEVLHWFTGDTWIIDFSQRRDHEVLCRTGKLPFFPSKEVALWSGGLDSFLGLCNRIVSLPSEWQFVLFGTGINDFIHGRQAQLAHATQKNFRIASNLRNY